MSGTVICIKSAHILTLRSVTIEERRTLKAVFEHVKNKTRYEVPEELETNLDEIRNIFKNPDVGDLKSLNLSYSKPDVEGLKRYLVGELGFNGERVDKGIQRLIKYGYNKRGIQKSITNYFKAVKN